MKESIIIVQQKWGFLLTQNLNYSNSGESSLMAQFAEVCGNFRNIVTPHPRLVRRCVRIFVQILSGNSASKIHLLETLNTCTNFSSIILWHAFKRYLKDFFYILPLTENRPYKSSFSTLMGVLKHVVISFEVQVIK